MKVILDTGVLCLNVLTMITVGMELERRHFGMVAQRKGRLILMLAVPAVVLPALALGLTHLLRLAPYLSGGILLLAACPVGDIANLYTLLAGANVALSVTVNTLSCVLSVVTMTIIFEAYYKLLPGQFIFAAPAASFAVRITLMIVLPVLIGMSLRRFKPGFVTTYAKTLRNVCVGGLVCLLVYIIVNQRAQIAVDWQQTATAGGAFMVLAMAFGLAFGWALRAPAKDTVTIGILLAVRNVSVAMVISITLLNRVEYAAFASVYFLTEVPLLLGIVAVFRRWWSAPVRSRASARDLRRQKTRMFDKWYDCV